MTRLLSLLLLILSSSIVFSPDAFGITDEEVFRNFRFTFVNPGARSVAMGGAFIGLADDATAAEANPAGLTILTKPEVSFEYRNIRTDPDEFDEFSSTTVDNLTFSVLTDFEAAELNRVSFLSVVFPVKGTTLAFSRQEAATLEVPDLFSLQSFPDFQLSLFFAGSQDLKVDNYNFTLATKLGSNFSIGGSVRYSHLDWQAETFNLLGGQDVSDVLFVTSLDDTDSAIAWNLGGLVNLGSYVSVGAVYKKNPKFEVEETQEAAPLGALLGFLNDNFTNVLKIPDSLGFGVAVKPNDNITVTSDIVYIEYSDLFEDFEPGHSSIYQLLGLTTEDVTFAIDNQWEYHLGLEFTVLLKNTPLALRAGYFRQPFASPVVESAPGLSNFGLATFNLLYPDPEVVNHFSWGAGVVLGSHFQLDFALDTSNGTDTFVFSSVVRF